MREIIIDTHAPYKVLIGPGLIGRSSELVAQLAQAPGRIMIVTDSNVGPLYAGPLSEALRAYDPFIHTIPAGEENKTPEQWLGILRAMAQQGLTRTDTVIALGGGVIGDMTGFAAAVYQRGMRFIQYPTTLLSAVDASLGGKTAVDLPEGKNLIGAFHQPSLVVCDTDSFRTLPKVRIADGAAEMIKHAVIADAELFARMSAPAWMDEIGDIVARNVNIKRSFVIGDEHDRGKRQMLNFGHTIGHAVEAWSGYEMSHGQAVAVGMVMETRAARKMGFSQVDENELIPVILANGLPVSTAARSEEIFRFAMHDKKRSQNSITVAVPVRIGEAALISLSIEDFKQFIKAGSL